MSSIDFGAKKEPIKIEGRLVYKGKELWLSYLDPKTKLDMMKPMNRCARQAFKKMKNLKHLPDMVMEPFHSKKPAHDED